MDHRLKALIEIRDLLKAEGWAPDKVDGATSDQASSSFTAETASGKIVRGMKLILAILCFVVLIGIIYSTAVWRSYGATGAPTVSASSEVMIQATVLSIDIANARTQIDASEDTLEADRCWVVKVAVNGRVPDAVLVVDQTLNLLVHSPSEALGVGYKGQVCKVRLRPTSGPAKFIVSPGHSGISIERPNTTHRRFSIPTIP